MPKVTQKEDITRIWAMGSICISDLPEGSVYTSPTNGKQYLSITIQNLIDIKVFGRNGFTHEIKAGPRDNQRTIGNMTEYKKDISSEAAKPEEKTEPAKTYLRPANNPMPPSPPKSNEEDSLPF